MRSRRQLVDGRVPDGTNDNDPVWNRLREIVRTVNDNPLNGGRMLDAEDKAAPGSGLVFTAGQTRAISHKLGRKAVGFVEVAIVDVPGTAHVGLFAAAQSARASEHFINVTATNSGRCAIWVF